MQSIKFIRVRFNLVWLSLSSEPIGTRAASALSLKLNALMILMLFSERKCSESNFIFITSWCVTHYGSNLYDYNHVRQLDRYLPHQNPWKSAKFPPPCSMNVKTSFWCNSHMCVTEHNGVQSAGGTRRKNRWVTQTGQTGPQFETWRLTAFGLVFDCFASWSSTNKALLIK